MELNSPRLLGYWTGFTHYASLARQSLWQWKPADLVGPLFFYDLVRLARRGRSILLRCLYALTLLAALCLAYASSRFGGGELWQQAFSPQKVKLSELADFSRRFMVAILLAQAAAVLAVTPVYLAGAIADEKEGKTLALLFASHLSDREIVLGKLFARLTHLGCVLLTGLPIVLLASLLGDSGNLIVLLSAFAVTGMTLLSAGSISMLCSVLCRNAMTALMCSYAYLLAFNLFWFVPSLGYVSSPVAFVFVLDDRLVELSQSLALASPIAWTPALPRRAPALTAQVVTADCVEMTTAYVLVHGLVAVLCIWSAIRNLRSAEPDPVFRTPQAAPRLVPVSTAFDMPQESSRSPELPAQRLSLLPPSSGDPLLWKEMVHDPPRRIAPASEGLRGMAVQVVLLSGVFWLLVLLGYCSWFEADGVQTLILVVQALVRLLGMATATFWCVGVAFRTASSLCRERDRRTLAMLLALPVDRSTILRARWLGGILRLRTFRFILDGIWLFGLLTCTLHPFALLLLAGSCGASVVFLASLGVWLAQVCRNTMRAQLSMALMLLVLFAGPWLRLINQSDPGQFSTDPEDTWVHLWQVGLNPFSAWWVSAFSWPEWREAMAVHNELFAARLRAVVHGIAVLIALAGIFWLAARRRLDMEPRD